MSTTASFVDTVTPSGVIIRFYDKAHRYKLGTTEEDMQFYPSVTTILGKAVPKELSGWGQRIGVQICQELAAEGVLPHSEDEHFVDQAIALGKERNLLWWQQRDNAGTRGTGAHDIFEGLSEGRVPDLGDVDERWRGHAQSVFSFWADHDPTPVISEALLGSLEHGYTGRCDAVLDIQGKRVLVDLKTSKSAKYDSQHLQLDGYRVALEECGYVQPGEIEEMWVLRTTDEGDYEVVPSPVERGAFLTILQSYKVLAKVQADLKNA